MRPAVVRKRPCLFYGCSTVVLIGITCPAITVVTVILRALDRVRERALGLLGARSPKSPPPGVGSHILALLFYIYYFASRPLSFLSRFLSLSVLLFSHTLSLSLSFLNLGLINTGIDRRRQGCTARPGHCTTTPVPYFILFNPRPTALCANNLTARAKKPPKTTTARAGLANRVIYSS